MKNNQIEERFRRSPNSESTEVTLDLLRSLNLDKEKMVNNLIADRHAYILYSKSKDVSLSKYKFANN